MNGNDDIKIVIDTPQGPPPPPKHVDACTFSPNGSHLATFSATDGIITIWNVDQLEKKGKTYHWQNNDTVLKSREKTKRVASDIDFALSNGGSFVALSTIKLPQECEDPIPFELETCVNKFFTYVVDPSNSRPITDPTLTNLKGAIKFSSDSTKLIVCDVQNNTKKKLLYIFSTRNWTLEKRDLSDIYDKFTNCLQSIHDPWNQVKFLKNSLLGDHFICVENWKLASLWSIPRCQLMTYIRCPEDVSFLNVYKEPAVFALSHSQKKLAAWTSEGVLTIFSCEGGAVLSPVETNPDTKSAGETNIIWIRGDQFVMIINATDGMQIRDVHTCAAITEDYVDIEPKSVFQPTGTGSYANYSKQLPSISKADVPTLPDDNLIINESLLLPPGTETAWEAESDYHSEIDSDEETGGKPNEDVMKPELTIDQIIMYQTESGSYELDAHLATFLGYDSVEVVQEELRTQFSSPSCSKFDDNVYVTAILLCYFQGAMANQRDMSILTDTCERALTWLETRIGDKRVVKELLESAKTFVIGRGLLILTVTPNCVRKFSNGRNWVQSNLSVAIVDASENEIAKIITATENTESVHYVPVSGSSDKIIFRVDERFIFRAVHLGFYELHINELFTENRVGKIKDFDKWEKIKSVDGRDHESEIHIEAQFIPMACLTFDKNFTFSEQNIEVRHLYAIILWKRPDNSYELDDRLARIFNFGNHQELLTNFKDWHSQVADSQIYDKQIFKHDEDHRILATALVIAYMRLICARYKSEWTLYVGKLRSWIDNQLYDVDVCRHLARIAKDFVRHIFGVTRTDIKVQPAVTIRTVTRLLTFQSEKGSFPLTDRIAAFYGFKTLEEHFGDSFASKVGPEVQVSAITAMYLKLVAVDYRNTWDKHYEKLSAWLDVNLGNAQIEADVFRSAKKFVLERFPTSAKTLETPFTIPKNRITRAHIETTYMNQHETGAFFINNELASSLGFDSEDRFRSTIITFKNKLSKGRLSRMNVNTWATVFVLLFWRLVAIGYQFEWQSRYEISYEWLFVKFKARESVEREAFERIKTLIKDLYEIDKETLKEDIQFEASFRERKNLIQSGRLLKEKALVGSSSLIGLIRLQIDSATIDQALGLFWLAGGNSDPYVTISDFATEWIYGETKIVYNSKKPVWKQVFYIPLYDQQKKLKLKVNDYNAFFKNVPLGACILDINNVVVRARETEEVKREKRDVDLRYKSNVTGRLRFDVEFISLGDDYFKRVLDAPPIGLDRLYFILSLQRQAGSFEIDDCLAKLFDLSTIEELIQPFQGSFGSLDKSIIVSVFVISFFKIVLPEHEKEWLTSYVKAENWITESMNDIETEEQIYKEAKRYIIKQFNVLESESQTDKAEGHTTLVSNQDIRRILSYQAEDGVYVLDARFAKLFGYESAEVARESLRAWFSSTSIDFDENIYATAVLQWYFRYVLVDHRDMWADAYKKSSIWLSAQIGDKEVERELLERAKEFVCNYYSVNEETLKKDMSFKTSKKTKTEEKDSYEEFEDEDEFDDLEEEEEEEFEEFECEDDYESDDELYEDEYDDIDTDLVGILRVKLDQVKGVLSSGRMDDFCVRIFKVNTGTAKKEAPVYTVNSVYGIHCVPVRSPKGQLLLEIHDQNSTDLSVGCFSLPLNEMIARNPDGTYSKKNTHCEQINAIRLEAEFYSTRVESDRLHFSKDEIDINDLYRLIGLTFNASSVDISNSLACYFNFNSALDLFHVLATRIMSDKQLASVNMRVWSTTLIITCIKIFYWKAQSEWTLPVNSLTQWISSQVHFIEVEKRLYEVAENLVMDTFNVTLAEEQENVLHPSVIEQIVRRSLNFQSKPGFFLLNGKTASLFEFNNSEEFSADLEDYFSSLHHMNVIDDRVKVTAITLQYWKLVAADFRNDWYESSAKAHSWLRSQLQNEIQLEKEVLECAQKFIAERYETDDGRDTPIAPPVPPPVPPPVSPPVPPPVSPPVPPPVPPPISPPVPPPVPPPVSSKGRRKRVHEFEAKGRNKVMFSTRSETRAVKQFVIEPWVTPHIKTAIILDDKNDRVLFIGKHTIQLWSNFTEERTLQYIWCRPIIKKNREKNFIKGYFIKWAELTRGPDGEFIIAFEYEVDGISNSIKTGFHLPRKDAPASFHTVRDASFALGFLNSFEQESWPTERYRRYETLMDECQGIIRRALSSSEGDVFEHVEDFGSIESTDESEHRLRPLIPLWLEIIGGISNDDSKAIWSKGSILKVLMQFDCERANTLIEELLKKEKISLRFYDLEKHECPQSDLSYAISLGRTEIVRSLLRYYCKSAEKSESMKSVNRNSKFKPNPENSLRLVVPAFSRLCSKHPGTAVELVKSISYFQLNRPAVWSNKRENFAYSDMEKSSDDVYKADANNDTVFKWSRFFSNEHRNESYPYLVCTVPLPNFTQYPEPPESRLGFLNVLKWGKYLSPFASAVLQGRYDMFGEPAMEAIINFKWRKFARIRYIFFIGVYFLYLASFMAAVTLDSERAQQGNETEHLIRFFSSVVLILGFIFIGLEVMQMIAYRSYYVTIYNLIDLASTLMPITYAIGALSGSDVRRQYVGGSMFFVYVNFILRLRVFKGFGIPIFIIIEIFNRVQGIMFIIAMMVVAYTHIYWLLLSYAEITDLVGNSTVIGQFATPEESLVSVFFFVTNNFGNISDAYGNPTIALLTIAFTFITAIVLLNILIALMSDVVGDAKTVGRHAWLKQKAELICELEMCTLTRKQRQRLDFFPYLIYYYAKSDSINEYKKRLEKHRKKENIY